MPKWNCVCSYLLYGLMWLNCSGMLSCLDLRLKTASSSSWGSSPTRPWPQKTLESHTSNRLSSLWTSRRVHWMSTSALSALLPWTRNRSDVILKNAPVSFAVLCGFPTYNLHSKNFISISHLTDGYFKCYQFPTATMAMGYIEKLSMTSLWYYDWRSQLARKSFLMYLAVNTDIMI